jgi:transposase
LFIVLGGLVQSACVDDSTRSADPSSRYSHELALLREKEIQRGNKNRAALAVARKMVAYMLAVERRQQDLVPAEQMAGKAVA